MNQWWTLGIFESNKDMIQWLRGFLVRGLSGDSVAVDLKLITIFDVGD